MAKEKEVRKSEAMILIAMIIDKLNIVSKTIDIDNYVRAEAEALVARDLLKSLIITIRRLERL